MYSLDFSIVVYTTFIMVNSCFCIVAESMAESNVKNDIHVHIKLVLYSALYRQEKSKRET